MDDRSAALSMSPMNDRAGARRAPAWVIDALLGLAVSLALALIVTTARSESTPPDLPAYVFVVGFGAVMVLRRRMPHAVLVLSSLGMFAYYTLDYPPIGVAIPVAAAVFSAAEAGLLLWSTGTAIVVLAVSTFFRVRDGGEPIALILGYESVSNIALFAAAIALGYSLRARRIQSAQQIKIVELTASQLTREAELRVQHERERLSRDLHDTMGHAMSVISLQANVAAEAMGRDNRAAGEALDRIRTASSRSLHELRSMVRVLRSADRDDTLSIASLSAVRELADAAREAGVEVTMNIAARPEELSAPVDAAAYRVIQEAITNIVRHAGATHSHVKVGLREGNLDINVTDNGRGAAGADSPGGFGLAGMSERVRLLGGTLTTRTFASGGFVVEATIPARVP